MGGGGNGTEKGHADVWEWNQHDHGKRYIEKVEVMFVIAGKDGRRFEEHAAIRF